ncbi:MAG: hypothetical protein ABWX74_12135 [Aeromicrobium sp.]|jgi:hypothetical protein
MTDKTRIELEPDGIDEVQRDITVRIDEVDSEVRAKCLGQSVQSIAEQAEDAFATIGVRLTGEQLAEYADAVSREAPFAFELD